MRRETPRILEVVGPAGAGKTTLCRNLTRGNRCFQLGTSPDVRRLADLPFFLWNGLQIIPTLLHLQRLHRQLNRREFAWLAILKGWPARLRKQLSRDERVIVLDQGPVYLLTAIAEFGPDRLDALVAENTWTALYGEWAALLGGIVSLDSGDAELLGRIRHRSKKHLVKKQSATNAFAFLQRSREAYGRTISRLIDGRADLRVFRFDTSRRSPGEIANQLLVEIGC